MQIAIFLSLLIALIGAVLYMLHASPKLGELGRLAFFAGLFVFLMQWGPHLIGKG